jgi:uncharacterized protein (DUF1800 family)
MGQDWKKLENEQIQIAQQNMQPVFKQTEKYSVDNDPLVLKYGNKVSPLGIRKATRGTINTYTGPWTKKEAMHLLKRAMYGAAPADVTTALNGSMVDAVDALLNTTPQPYPDGVNWYENTYPDTTGVALGASWTNADWGDGNINYWRQIGLKGRWIKNMIQQNFSLQEKMVLFLYNMCPVNYGDGDARFMYRYTQMLHQFAMGNYKDFLKALTKDGAMLYYLNGYVNNKYSPDENYARELQELFSVGKYNGQQFAEDDVKKAAKVLTGWRIDFTNINTYFDVNFHDTSDKLFSNFYNNATVYGSATNTAGDDELNNLLDIIMSGDSGMVAAKYLCRKIYRFFVYYDIDTNIETNIITPLANTFVANNWELKPVLEQLFKSDHFFEMQSQGCYIKTPADIMVGLIRTMNIQPSASLSFDDEHWVYVRHNYNMLDMGMGLGEVPNVSGFKPYYQTPQWHQLFINTNSLPKRMRWTDNMTTAYGQYISANASFSADLPAFAASMSNPSDPDILVQDIIDYTFGIDISAAKKTSFKNMLLSGQTSNGYWTQAWVDYTNNPTDPVALNTVTTRLRGMLTELFRMPEFHLC